MPDISFIVTYCNSESTVRLSLDSILNLQGDFSYEILVGDDGSTDRTCDIVKEYICRYPGVISLYIHPHDPSEVQYKTRWAGLNRLSTLRHSKGRYVCFIDGDDAYNSSDFPSKAIKMLDSQPKLIGCAFNFERIKDETSSGPELKFHDGLINTRYYIERIYIHSNAIVFRNIFSEELIEFLAEKVPFSDNIITIFMLHYGPLYFYNDVMYRYYQYGESLWNDKTSLEKSIENALDYHRLANVVPEFRLFLLRRFFPNMDDVYRSRRKINETTVKRLRFLVQIAEHENDPFMRDLLLWNSISPAAKVRVTLMYYGYRLKKGHSFIKHQEVTSQRFSLK